jgi:hypothetical protein
MGLRRLRAEIPELQWQWARPSCKLQTVFDPKRALRLPHHGTQPQRAGQASRAAEPHTSIDPAFSVWCCPLADRSTALHGRTANSLLSHSSRILWTPRGVHTTYVAQPMAYGPARCRRICVCSPLLGPEFLAGPDSLLAACREPTLFRTIFGMPTSASASRSSAASFQINWRGHMHAAH